MIDVAIVGDGRLARGVADRLRSDGGVAVRGLTSRADRHSLLTSGADVVLIATTTLLTDVADDIRTAILAGSNVLVSAEEAAHPWEVDRALGAELDALARNAGVTVLGAGLNPGFLFDALVVTLAGLHTVPDSILVSRVVDLSGYGPAVRARLGLGFDREGFAAGAATGTILGHAGFRQSMHVVAAALGVLIERVDAHLEPLVDADDRTAGVVQHYTAVVAGAAWYRAEFTGHVAPEQAGLATRDSITIVSGVGTTTSVIEPGVPSLSGAISVISNSIRRVVGAAPGWRTVAELPPAHPVLPHPVPGHFTEVLP